jgi:hypothetical protein
MARLRPKSARRQKMAPTPPVEVRPWEEIEAGRYQPRRIRGSCRGRELG